MEWQPIKTAPRDGSFILLAGGEVDTVWYDKDAIKPPAVVGWFARVEDGYPVWNFCSFDSGTYGDYDEPSHWMPLPTPPST